MYLTRAEYTEEKKDIAKLARSSKRYKKQMQSDVDKLAGEGPAEFQKEVASHLKDLFGLVFGLQLRERKVEAEIGVTIGDLLSVIDTATKAIVDLKQTTEILRAFAAFQKIEVYRLQHGRDMSGKERIGLVKALGLDPAELKRERETAEQKAKKGTARANP